MGTSATKLERSQEQKDIQYLGDRFPFGDAELLRLYRSYVDYRSHKHTGKSFLADWARHSVVLPPGETDDEQNSQLELLKERQSALLQIIEQNILPPLFGEHLERVAFLHPTDQQEPTSATLHDKKVEDNDYVRLSRLETFFDGLANCERRGGRAALGTLFQCCVDIKGGGQHPVNSKDLVDSKGDEIKARVLDVLDLAYRISLATSFLLAGQPEDRHALLPANDSIHSKAIQSLATSCIDHVHRQRIHRTVPVDGMDDSDLEQGFCSKMDFLEWSEATAPLLSSILPTFMHYLLFPEKPFPPSRTPFVFPRLPDESAFFRTANTTLLFSFACMSKALGGEWHRLYTSVSDGLSFNRLQNALLGYGGPTLIVIQATNAGIFGAFTASPWKESKDFYGNSDCFLYQLLPLTAVYRPSGSAKNYMYCNSEARSRGYDQLPHGIGFGGSVSASGGPRLFLTESLEECVASSQDLTFQTGPLLPKLEDGTLQKTTFDIDQLEVWGCGGDEVVAEALQSRARQRELRASHIQKARKVDKAAFLDDFGNGLIESKAFKHRDQIQGSSRCEADDRMKSFTSSNKSDST